MILNCQSINTQPSTTIAPHCTSWNPSFQSTIPFLVHFSSTVNIRLVFLNNTFCLTLFLFYTTWVKSTMSLISLCLTCHPLILFVVAKDFIFSNGWVLVYHRFIHSSVPGSSSQSQMWSKESVLLFCMWKVLSHICAI